MKKITVMGHLVIGYPTLYESYQIAKLYIKNGIDILELQIPFSNPTADGSIITTANKVAINNRVSWKDCLNFLNQIQIEFPNQKVYLMTYLNKLLAVDIKKLFYNLIVPDLPFDSFEYLKIEERSNIKLIPVIGVNISEYRLNALLQKKPEFIYLMSGFKITGSFFNLHKQLYLLIQKIKQKSFFTKIGIGFGVNSYKDAESIAQIADVVIVGTAFIKAQQLGKLQEKIFEIQGKLNYKVR